MNKKSSQEILENKPFYPYIEKWRKIIYSTESIDKIKATEVIKQAYNILNLKEPDIIFFSSPKDAESWFAELDSKFQYDFKYSHYHGLRSELSSLLSKYFYKDIVPEYYELDDLFYVEKCLFRDACDLIYELIYEAADPGNHWYKMTADVELVCNNLCAEDYFISEFKIDCDLTIWNTLKSLAEECPYIFAFTGICIVIERPNKIYLDNNYLIHREGEPAVSYTDGYNIYAYHGIEITEKYGKLSLDKWQPKWILEEKDYCIKEALIKGIGFDRFSQKFPEHHYIYWKEYRTRFR